MAHMHSSALRAYGTPGPQGRTRDQDVSVATRYQCSTCQITYYVPRNGAPLCPLCQSQLDVDQCQSQLEEANSKIRYLESELKRLRAETDSGTDMRQTIELMDDRDRTFLKTAIYRYRQDKTIGLTVLHAGEKTPNGLMVRSAHAVVETHQFSSVGGVAFAYAFELTCKRYKLPEAMRITVIAVGDLLAPDRPPTIR